MGRKKVRGLPMCTAEETTKALKETFLALVDPPHDETRTRLIGAIRAFSARRNEDDCDDLLVLEDLARRLRADVVSFEEYLIAEREEVGHAYRELRTNIKANHVHEHVAVDSIFRSHRKQISQEVRILNQLTHTLDTLYSVPRNHEQFLLWIWQLSERLVSKDALRVFKLESISNHESNETAVERCVDEDSGDGVMASDSEIDDNLQNFFELNSPLDVALHTFSGNTPSNSTVLVLGPTGSGKTHACDEIEKEVRKLSGVTILRPKIPVDFMGPLIGDAENAFLSLLTTIQCADEKILLILDDLDLLLGSADESKSQYCSRFRLSFLSFMDRLDSLCRSNFVIICTSCTPLDDELRRFKSTFVLELPSHKDRILMFKFCLGIHGGSHDTERAVEKLSTCLIGRSRAEIGQYCRHVIQSSLAKAASLTIVDRQRFLVESLIAEVSHLNPASHRVALHDDYLDMTVTSATELSSGDDGLSFSLVGESLREAWRQLDALVVTPLCRSDALDSIISGVHNDTIRSFCGGVLLTGAAGTGKSALALHAARVASVHQPSLKLLNVSCTSLVHKEVGGSERAVRKLFTAVRASAPCIVIMDGIENIAAVRGNDITTYGTMDRVLSTLLTELDGVHTSSHGASAKFAVIGITHNSSWIDTALCRPGRLEKIIYVEKPNFQERQTIAFQKLSQLDLEETVNIDVLSRLIAEHTHDKTAADIFALCEDARMTSLKEATSKMNAQVIQSSVKPTVKLIHFATRLTKSAELTTLPQSNVKF